MIFQTIRYIAAKIKFFCCFPISNSTNYVIISIERCLDSLRSLDMTTTSSPCDSTSSPCHSESSPCHSESSPCHSELVEESLPVIPGLTGDL